MTCVEHGGREARRRLCPLVAADSDVCGLWAIFVALCVTDCTKGLLLAFVYSVIPGNNVILIEKCFVGLHVDH